MDPTIRIKIQRLFRYLQELYQSKNPPAVHMDRYDWNLNLDTLPYYTTVQRGLALKALNISPTGEGIGTDPEYIFKSERPRESECPLPTVLIENWLRSGWDDFGVEPRTHTKRETKDPFGKPKTELFGDSAERIEAFESWKQEKQKWEKSEKLVFAALDVFSSLFELRGRLEREFEKFELFLADGIIVTQTPNGPVHHPILLQEVQLVFDTTKPSFTIKESHKSPILYTPVLRFLGIDGKDIHKMKTDISEKGLNPLDFDGTTEFFKGFVQKHWPNGQYFSQINEVPPSIEGPYLYRRPFIFLGFRNPDFIEALERYIGHLETAEDMPESLVRIVGHETKKKTQVEVPQEDTPNILLTKHANPEQIRVITELDRNGAVLVQGPPGTGKSHTIANLIGHLLAQNKRILITSHTSKALRVVKQHVAEAIRPLCVSALQNDEDSGKELEESVSGILNYLSKSDPKKFEKEIEMLGKKRSDLLRQIGIHRLSLLKCFTTETTVIDSSLGSMKRYELALKLNEDREAHGWIPGPLIKTDIPISESDLKELYQLQEKLKSEEEGLIGSQIPGAVALPDLKTFQNVLDQIKATNEATWKLGKEYWSHDNQSIATLNNLVQTIQGLLRDWEGREDWIYECTESGWIGPAAQTPWTDFVTQIREVGAEAPALDALVVSHDPAFSTELRADYSTDELLVVCNELIEYLKTHTKLGTIATLVHRKWVKFIRGSSVEKGSPLQTIDFEALRAKLRLEHIRGQLLRRWDRQMGPLGAKPGALLGARPERACLEYVVSIEEALRWKSRYWDPLARAMEDQGLSWESVLHRMQGQKDLRKINKHLSLLETQILPVLKAREAFQTLRELEKTQEGWLKTLEGFSTKDPAYPLVKSLREAIRKSNYDQYREGWEKLAELNETQALQKKRNELLSKLEETAPKWCENILKRVAPHNEGKLPGKLENAWKYRLAVQQLHANSSLNADDLEAELNEMTDSLHEISSQLVEKRAWLAQIGRTTLVEQQALNGWLGLYKKIGKGTGKQVGRLKEEAKKALSACLGAVPVWILPMSRLTETFDLVTTKFDVVLIDEASQSDVMGLVALAYGKEAVVVGDHEQVSPYAVGFQIERVQALIDEILVDIPNKQLYDGRTSVYDLARQSFGGTIRLIEHFRCVPEIIQFCNDLSYGGEILPLRESTSGKFNPHVVVRKVEAGVGNEKENEAEAHEIASTICAMVRMPEFEDATIGVICLVGTEQALKIDAILRRRLGVSEYQTRRILCGNASQFQGDERDIIFLSVVDTPAEGKTLTLRSSDEWRKIYNVAVSRARDQLWIVHSLDSGRDLKKGDLRLKLLQYAEELYTPKEERAPVKEKPLTRALEQIREKLQEQGIEVIPHYCIADFKIDLVVKSGGRRVGILYYGEADLLAEERKTRVERQLALKRLGWTFLNVSATRFYFDPDAEVKRILTALRKMGIRENLAPTKNIVKNDTTVQVESTLEVLLKKAENMRTRWKE